MKFIYLEILLFEYTIPKYIKCLNKYSHSKDFERRFMTLLPIFSTVTIHCCMKESTL